MNKFILNLIIIIMFCSSCTNKNIEQKQPNYRSIAGLHMKSENYKVAIKNFNKAIEINPNDARLYTGRGRCKFELNDYQGALIDFNKAIEINPDSAGAYFSRAKLNKVLQKEEAFRSDAQEANRLFKERDIRMGVSPMGDRIKIYE